jgi:hypothetical protein
MASIEEVITYDLNLTRSVLMDRITCLKEFVNTLEQTVTNYPTLSAYQADFVASTATEVLVRSHKLTTLAKMMRQLKADKTGLFAALASDDAAED